GGRLAGRRASAVVIGDKRTESRPAWRRVSCANSNQEQEPSFVTCKVPRASRRTRSRIILARSRVKVGDPSRSATTVSSDRVSEARRIFSGKQARAAPKSQEVRAM